VFSQKINSLSKFSTFFTCFSWSENKY